MSVSSPQLAAVLRNAYALARGRPVRPWEQLSDCERFKWDRMVDEIAAEYQADPLFVITGEWLYATWVETRLLFAPPYRTAAPEVRRCWDLIAKTARAHLARLSEPWDLIAKLASEPEERRTA